MIKVRWALLWLKVRTLKVGLQVGAYPLCLVCLMAINIMAVDVPSVLIQFIIGLLLCDADLYIL